MNYNNVIQCGSRLTLCNANTSHNFFRSLPLFTIDDRANFLLENNQSIAQDLWTMARTIEKDVAIGTDMPEGSKWEGRRNKILTWTVMKYWKMCTMKRMKLTKFSNWQGMLGSLQKI